MPVACKSRLPTLAPARAEFKPDWLVLSTGIAPGGQPDSFGPAAHHADRRRILLEAHPSCARWTGQRGRIPGRVAHSPRFIDETIGTPRQWQGGRPRFFARQADIAGQVPSRSRRLRRLRHLREAVP